MARGASKLFVHRARIGLQQLSPILIIVEEEHCGLAAHQKQIGLGGVCNHSVVDFGGFQLHSTQRTLRGTFPVPNTNSLIRRGTAQAVDQLIIHRKIQMFNALNSTGLERKFYEL